MTEFEALMLSAMIEAPVAWLLVRWRGWPCRGAGHAALASALATAMTHPQLWAGVNWLTAQIGYFPALALGEIAVVIIEAAVIAWAVALSPIRALLLSLATNAAFSVAGVVLVFLV